MKPHHERLLIAIGIGILLAMASYALEIIFRRAGIAVADTVLDNLVIGTLGGSLTFAWATMQARAELQKHLADVTRNEAKWEERRRIAREIHDTLAQELAGIILQLEAAENIFDENPREAGRHLDRARTLARESLAEARRSVWELRSQSLEGGDLPDAFEHFIRRLTVGKRIQAKFSLQGNRRPLSQQMEVSLLRIGQEALTNVIKHAQASKVHVELTYRTDEVGLLVEDDGRGFDTHDENAKSGFGLTSLRERAANLGGQLTIESGPERGGTRIIAAIPVHPIGAP